MILFLAAWFLRERITPAFIVLSLIAVAGMVVDRLRPMRRAAAS